MRGPERASEAAAAAFLHAVLARGPRPRGPRRARQELGIALDRGGARGRRARASARAGRGRLARAPARARRARARAIAPGAIAAVDAAPAATAAKLVLLPGADGERWPPRRRGRAARAEANLSGFAFAVGRSRVARDPVDLHRAGDEALLAANVAEGDPDDVAAGLRGHRRLPAAAARHERGPGRAAALLRRDGRALVAYDEQYETELVGDARDVPRVRRQRGATAARLVHAPPHGPLPVRARARDHRARRDSTDGREKLSLGLKAMRVLGIAAPRGPASERGVAAGRVRREAAERPVPSRRPPSA